MTKLKTLTRIGLNKRFARSILRGAEMIAKDIKRDRDRRNNILNKTVQLPDPF